jgi:excinuclease ABC subunit C
MELKGRLVEERKHLPRAPGVYIFHGEDGDILYIGKAKSLRNRVNSYFSGSDTRPRIPQLVAECEHIEFILTSSEGEALQLEQRLIKDHRPPYNVRLREGRGYPYLSYRPQDDYPRLELSWAREEAGRVYFGPYMSASRARATLKTINRVFRYRIGKLNWDSGLKGFDANRENAERLQATPAEYRRELERVCRFLGGESAFLEKELREQMVAAAADQEYERAARYRDGLAAVRELVAPQLAQRALGSVDIIGLAQKGDTASVQVFLFREGELIDRHGFYLDGADGKTEDELLEAFCLEYYDGREALPPQVVIPARLECREGLEEFLSLKRGAPVEVRVPLRGEKVRLQELADENARLAVLTPPDPVKRRLDTKAALEELAASLSLEAAPQRIECYDISNLQDLEPVAAMVVFVDGKPQRSHYRKFAMRYEGGQDDFKMMREVILRRFGRYQSDESTDASFSALPDLIVIDGGKGQLAAAVQAMHESGVQPPTISLAKREEEVFLPGRPNPIVLDRLSPALHLLQRLRDETHRVAVSYHRQRRSRSSQQSVLDTMPGVGPKRKKQLLEHFETPARLQEASLVELEAVPSLPKNVARAVYEHLHPQASV